MTTRDQLDRASKRHPTGEFGIFAAARDEIDQLQAEVAVLRGALEWYGEQARLARLIHSEGDIGRHSLQADGGKKARAALNKAGPVVLATSDVVKAVAKEAREKALDEAGRHAASATGDIELFNSIMSLKEQAR